MYRKIKIKIIKLNKGNIIKLFDFNKKNLKNFKEIYFSEIKKNHFKGWKYHEKRNQLLSVCTGKVDFFLKKKITDKPVKIRISYPNELYLLFIPKKTHYCFKSLTKKKSMIVNIIDEKV